MPGEELWSEFGRHGIHTPDRNGLLLAHAYSVLRVEITKEGVKLLNLRNPWGALEWKGEFSDNHPSWTKTIVEQIKPKFGDDGCFWMNF